MVSSSSADAKRVVSSTKGLRDAKKSGGADATSAPRSTGGSGQRVPPPRLYLYFDAIARCGSIRAAAEQLKIASSALNRRLLDLEEEVGTLLFDRLTKGVRLTPAGEIFAAHVRRTLNDIEQVTDRMLELRGSIHGRVNIGSAESAAVDFLPRAIAAFHRDFPHVRFTVAVGDPGTMLADLLDDQVDLILTHEEPRHASIAIIGTAQKPFCAMMRPSHPLSGRQRLFIRECQDYPIVLAQEDMAARMLVDTALSAGAVNLRPVLVTNMFEVMKHYVRATDAVSFQFHFGQLGVPDASGLLAIPLADPFVAHPSLTLAVRRGRTLSASAVAMCERLRMLLDHTAAV